MFTAAIETAANRGNIATADFNIGQVLRRAVVPEFLLSVGDALWRRKKTTVTTVAGTQAYDLPTDFDKMIAVYPPYQMPGNNRPGEGGLIFIGEDPDRVALAEITTQRGVPRSYYITTRGDNTWGGIKFDAPPDQAYAMVCSYVFMFPWADDTTTVNMDLYIPASLHWALVCGLRREIMLDRYGQGDTRYQEEKGRFEGWKKAAGDRYAQANRNYVKTVR